MAIMATAYLFRCLFRFNYYYRKSEQIYKPQGTSVYFQRDIGMGDKLMYL